MSTLKVGALQGISASSDAITLANDGTCTANITNNLSNRRLTINGAMTIAQRGTSSTSDTYATVDRIFKYDSGVDESSTQSQVDVSSGTTPYSLGFRKAFKVTNGNQTSGAGAADVIEIITRLEAQDIANSGWNYTSSSSFITLSFWVKSSVAQNFFVHIQTADGASQNYPFETGSLTADTWTKVTNTIPGNSNLQFDNNNEKGLDIKWQLYRGTNSTGSVSLNAWAAYSSSTRTPNNTSTWYTTNDATFEITGLQLEVGSVATDFEHRSFAQELSLCQRYYQVMPNSVYANRGYGSEGYANMFFPVTMRDNPTFNISHNFSGTQGLSANTYGIRGYFTHNWNTTPQFSGDFVAEL